MTTELNRTNASLVASLRTRPTAASIISTMPAAIQKQNTKSVLSFLPWPR